MDENKTPPSIAWVKQYVEGWFETFGKMIGAETGDMEKRLREQMHTHVASETALVRALILIERKKRWKRIKRKIIENLTHRIKSIEAMFAQPANVLIENISNTTDRRLM